VERRIALAGTEPCSGAGCSAPWQSIQPQSESSHCANQARRKILAWLFHMTVETSVLRPSLFFPCSAFDASLLLNNREGGLQGVE
jgi:hypothetical protein